MYTVYFCVFFLLLHLQLAPSASSSSPYLPRNPLLLNLSIPSPDSSPISPFLFGLDLEFTRHDIWEGLSAQLIANRYFSLQPPGTSWPYPWPSNFPPRWTPIGTPSVLSPFLPPFPDPTSNQTGILCTFNSTTSFSICGVQQNSYADGFNSGMSGGNAIGLLTNINYNLRLIISVLSLSSPSAAIPLTVTFTDVLTLSTNITAGYPDLSSFQTIDFNFTSPRTVTSTSLLVVFGNALSIDTYDGTSVRIFSVSLLPISPGLTYLRTLRQDTVDQLRSLQFTGPLRYPGGCFAPFYQWKNQLLNSYDYRNTLYTPPDYCTAVSGGVNAYSDGFLENGPNIDEYIQLTRTIGVTPAITIALQFGTAQEIQDAIDLVEYCNGPSSSPWGSIRTQRGYPEPYNVSIWYLGNEINMQARYSNYPLNIQGQGPPSPQEYATMLSNLVPAMLAIDPTIQLLAVEGGSNWDTVWTTLPSVGPYIYATSFHGGYANSGPGGSPANSQDCTVQAKIPTTTFLNNLQALRTLLNSSALNASHVKLSCDEWGLGPPWTVQNFNTAHAMYGASFLSTMINNAVAQGIEWSNYFEPINEGAITVLQFSAHLTPLGVIMPLFSAYGNYQRYILVENSTNNVNPVGTDDDIVSVVGTQTESSTLLITLSNRNATVGYAQTIVMDPPPSSSYAVANVTYYIATDTSSTSVFMVDNNVVSIDKGTGSVTIQIPPFSIVQARITYP